MKERVIALGFFDGVHLGHAALLRRTAEEAARRGCIPAVFTFDRPPKEVVTGVPCPLINSPEDRRDLVRRLYGIKEVILAPFDREMMTTSWEDFVTELLVGRWHAVHLVAGHDHRFGHKNAGTPELLKEKCAALGLCRIAQSQACRQSYRRIRASLRRHSTRSVSNPIQSTSP